MSGDGLDSLRDREFQTVFREGRRVERPLVLLFWRSAGGSAKAGFAVSRRVRGAVLRNRSRRRLREACRVKRRCLPSGVQVVLVARPALLARPFESICRDVGEGFQVIAERCRATAGR